MTTTTQDQSARAVDRHFGHRGFGAEFEMEIDWIRSHLARGATRVIEIGCGIGALFPILGEARVIGIDYAFDGLQRTATRFPDVPLVCASAECLPLKDECAEAIIIQHVIEHLEEYSAACREWRRVLRPGGLLLVLTPNAAFCDQTVFHDDTHVHLFTADDLRGVLCHAGFDVTDVRTLGLSAFRDYHERFGGWRLRRFVTEWATPLSSLPGLRWRGQTLCCAATPMSDG